MRTTVRIPRWARARALIALVALVPLFWPLAACCEFSGPRYHGRRTAHFDGTRFHNPLPGVAPGPLEVMRWRLSRHPGAWPDHLANQPQPPPPERVGQGEVRVTMINHATTLIQLDGINVLTDPLWGEVAGPTDFLGRQRHREPGLRLEDLPPIDAVLISHDHYDHLDIPALVRIAARHHPRILAGLGQGKLLAAYGIHGVTELDWWQWAAVGRTKIWGVPARHGCRRGACDDNARLWLGYVLRSKAGDVYFAGDTGQGPHLQQIADRFGPPRLALLPISPGTPRALFAAVHFDAADAVAAARVLRAREVVPIHFGTFSQGDEGAGEAEGTLRRALEAPGSPPFHVLQNGETFTSSPAAGVS